MAMRSEAFFQLIELGSGYSRTEAFFQPGYRDRSSRANWLWWPEPVVQLNWTDTAFEHGRMYQSNL